MCIQTKMKIRGNNHLNQGKRIAGNCVVIFALFFETSMPKIYNLLLNYEILPD